MNILVIGCGKVGSNLARRLEQEGHEVAVVDKNPDNFERLSDDFDGLTVTGVPFDEDVLREAGVENCDALAAVTPDDNTNIMVAQVAREIFHVPAVLSRIYDPQRKDVFAHFGLHTVCPTNLTVDAITQSLTTGETSRYMTVGSSTVSYRYMPLGDELYARNTDAVVLGRQEQLFGVLRESTVLELYRGKAIDLQPGDTIITMQVVD
ncbi:TrkA family potassium uptake protein [Neobittarella massiliensis]|uniref:TrkA family potassium uptake protein n=1 Tax=Neobittarella massiliensis (ex Bilen et al. 2018) TaxID=2041842 RepID=A0A8J6LUZ8_9FIRM|nr:TrkA family potassium uptake protein [Neobittarella massiliensis]MBC3517369.1 TrkA family potassium uptake protein [Neobittarella massiliensis]